MGAMKAFEQRRSRQVGVRLAALLVAAAVLVMGAACSPGAAVETSASVPPLVILGAEVVPPMDVPPLHLIDHNGAAFDLEALRGDVVALFWGYLSCPDVCPLTLNRLATARAALPADEQADFHVVMVTVDPERDDPEAMLRYISNYGPGFVGVSGEPADIANAMATWGVLAERTPHSGGGYSVSHPAQITLIDRDGRWAVSQHYEGDPADIQNDVRALLYRPAGDNIVAAGENRGGAVSEGGDQPLGSVPFERSAQAPTGWLQARDDGSVWHMPSNQEFSDDTNSSGLDDMAGEEILAAWSRREPLDPVNSFAELGAPTIAYDPVADRLWYSDSHNSIRSVSMLDGEPGPSFESFADTAFPGCGVASNGRIFAIDPARRLLFAPSLTGQVLAYDLDTHDVRGNVPAAAFGEPLMGSYRIVAIDPGASMWAIATNGDVVEYDLATTTKTGRVITAAATGLTIDADRGLLLMSEVTGMRAVSLLTLRDVDAGLPSLQGARTIIPHGARQGPVIASDSDGS